MSAPITSSELAAQYAQQAVDKRNAGRYTLEEAATMLEKETGERGAEMLGKLMQAVRDGALAVHEPGKQARYQSDTIYEFYEEAYWNDLNDWLKANEPRIAWRFPDPQGYATHLVPNESATDNRPKWGIPGRLEYDARQIGEEWMLAEETRTGERPGVDTIAKYVEEELKNRDRRGPRGDYWDWQTVKKEALTGITGRKANGKE